MPKSPKLKVGLVFDDSLDSNDGVAQYVKTLGPWLGDHGCEVRYLVGETNQKQWRGSKVYSLSTNLKVRFNGNHLSMPLISKKAQLKRVLRGEQFDILHVMTPYSPLMAQRLIMMAGPTPAVVGTFHIFPSGQLSKIGAKLLKLVSAPSLKKFDKFVSVSRPAKEFAQQSYGIKSSIIPNPININMLKTKKSNKPKKQIVFLGRLVKRKGCSQLIRAFAKIEPQYPEYELVIAGDGPQRESLKKLAVGLGIGQKVTFLGYIKEEDKPGVLGSATIACFPSLYGESFGIVLIEAMAAGACVVLGGNNPGYNSVLDEMPQLLFDPRSANDLSDLLIKYLDDPALRKRVSQWQQETVKQYDIDVVGIKILRIYQDAIANHGEKRHNKRYE